MPPLGGYQPVRFSLRDATGEVTTTTVYADEITAISLPGLLTEITALQTAIAGITLGEISKTGWGEETIVSNATPTNPAAQRESKLLVQYQDTTTEKQYTLTVGTVDFATLVFLPGAGDAVAFTSANGASAAIIAFVTAFEALASPPDNEGNDVEVVGMRYVGRNT